MAVAQLEKIKKFTTGNDVLDFELSFLTEENLTKLANYAKYLVWSQNEEDKDDNDWADAPLTPEEEEGLRQGRENAKNGDYLTLKEFRESQKCGTYM